MSWIDVYHFGLSDDESDKDHIVIIDEYDGTNVIKEDSYDFFVIGEPYFKKLCRLNDRVMCYFAIWLITFFWLKTI